MKVRVGVFPCGSENAIEIHDALSCVVGIEVFGFSSIDDHGRHVFRNYVGNIPYISDPVFIEFINDIIKLHSIDLLFPTHDSVAKLLAERRADLACKLVVSDYETTCICREKRRIYSAFKGCPFTPTIYDKDYDNIEFPVFVKPNKGQGSKYTKIVRDRDDLKEALRSIYDPVVVEYLPGEELTVDCFTDRHGTLRFIGPRSRSRIRFGISVNSRSIPVTPEIGSIAAEMNRRLRFRGLWFFQIKKDESGRFKILEISTRTAGTMCLYRHQGLNFPLLSVYDALDRDVEVIQNTFNIEVDRTLTNRFSIDYEFDTIYLDYDDTLVCDGKVNIYILMLLYQWAHQKKQVILLTRHDKCLKESFEKFHIHESLFTKIYHFDWNQEKAELIDKDKAAIFIDNAFSERKKVFELKGIPVFDVDAVDCLLDWRR
jgi:hypothetical protein